ncbi:hypothetical protein [Acidipropionibacterium jensenii]|uniref:Uncharacterized protein n=1 Tax=Acidipropionibacterium jensenii TaxID=1749 RepID=A0A448NWL4_9ACTN|nr:hypothetical protein [Acidipropionibacterium jensenii]MDN5997370.1 hypothetical protein [Acidipropionibacterium jensenii]MDN6426360.1 hypothetical protein [Acidipropionibacterium jensenii]MDN6442790.1 hypothetical protein [Acidipropionibacterium jensenii]MDN6480479.1 hypothetical protein [Acidipropionibacterium jensenii]MDN6513984.1 hypothetical protein [Acidipropionibacterium jensenii]
MSGAWACCVCAGAAVCELESSGTVEVARVDRVEAVADADPLSAGTPRGWVSARRASACLRAVDPSSTRRVACW